MAGGLLVQRRPSIPVLTVDAPNGSPHVGVPASCPVTHNCESVRFVFCAQIHVINFKIFVKSDASLISLCR